MVRLTKEELELNAAAAVTEGKSWKELQSHLFGPSVSSVSKVTTEALHKMYREKLEATVEFGLTEMISQLLHAGNSNFIRKMRKEIESKPHNDLSQSTTLYGVLSEFMGSEAILLKNVATLPNPSGDQIRKRLATVVRRHFLTLAAVFAPTSAERELCNAIVAWFQSGEMSCEQRKQMKALKSDICLKSWRSIAWEEPKKSGVAAFIRALNEISTDDFTLVQELGKLLGIYLADPKFEVTSGVQGKTLSVQGRSFFLSELALEFKTRFGEDPQITEVHILAKDSLGMDMNLENWQWNGKNLCIVTDKLVVWKQIRIDLSGKSFGEVSPATAPSGAEPGANGTDGVDGRAGGSSGNATILANQFSGIQLLRMTLNGGRGENGQNGGKGAHGRDGHDVKEKELCEACVQHCEGHLSLYRTPWSTFMNYNPDLNIWKNEICYTDYPKGYLFKKYVDANGRKAIYSMAAHKGYVYSTFELYFIIFGTKGGPAGKGGANGLGGEGGMRGELKVQEIRSGKPVTVTCERTSGDEGQNGICGQGGLSGINGNDMAIIDRSAKASSFHIIGYDRTCSLTLKHKYESESMTRLDGYQKYIEGNKACFVEINESRLDPGGRRTGETKKRTSSERTDVSKTVCKQTIDVSAVLAEFSELFANDEAVLQSFCQERVAAEFEEDDEVNQETKEVVQEEVTVIRQNPDGEIQGESQLNKESHLDPQEVCDAISRFEPSSANFNDAFIALYSYFLVELPWNNELHEKAIGIAKFLNDQMEQSAQKSTPLLPQYSPICGFDEASTLQFCKDSLNRLEKKSQFCLNVEALSGLEKSIEPCESFIDLTLIEVNNAQTDDSDVFKEFSSEDKVAKLVRQVFDRLEFYSANFMELTVLHDLYVELEKKYGKALEPFRNNDLNWAQRNQASAHLKNFGSLPVAAVEEEKKEEHNFSAENKTLLENAPINDNEKMEEAWEVLEGSEDVEVSTSQESGYFSRAIGFAKDMKSKAIKACQEAVAKVNADGTLLKRINENLDDIKQIFEKLKQLATVHESLRERFGDSHGNIAGDAHAVIRTYFLAEQIFSFNTKIMRYLRLYEAKILIPTTWYEGSLKETPIDKNFYNFRNELAKGFELDSSLEAFMKRHGVGCAAFRQLLADECKICIKLYAPSGLGSFRLTECLNNGAEIVETAVCDSEGHFRRIMIDQKLFSFLRFIEKARNFALPQSFLQSINADLTRFFVPAAAPVVREWSQACERAMGTDHYLRMLAANFELNGCHVRLVDLQFIISTAIDAVVNCGLSVDSIAARSMDKQDFLDEEALKLRLALRTRGQVDILNEEISNKIFLIKDSRIRALFGSKLHEYQLDKDTIGSLLNMMEHARDKFAQLERIHLNDWVDIAKRQRWTDQTKLLEHYGEVGYYISYLDASNKETEKLMLQRLINALRRENYAIPEKFIARLAYLITSMEIDVQDGTFQNTLELFRIVNENESCFAILSKARPEIDVRSKNGFRLVVNEAMQNKLIRILGKSDETALQVVFPDTIRTLEQLVKLAHNREDSEEEKEMRHAQLEHIANALHGNKVNQKEILQCAELMEEIDGVLKEKFNIVLRDTQKLAVVYTAATEQHVLSQVNTGEGKSYIIAALAILMIRRSEGKETVDVITSSSVLAQRDTENLRSIYEEFGISVAHNCDEDLEKRKTAYKAAVVYGDIARFQRDYLMHTFYKRNILGSRQRCNVIVDEVDNMLLDNGNNILYLSHNIAGLEMLESLFAFIYKQVCMPVFDQDTTEFESEFSNETIKNKVLSDLSGRIPRSDIQQLIPDSQKNATAWLLIVQHKIVDANGLLQEFLDEDFDRFLKALSEKCGDTEAEKIRSLIIAVVHREREIDVPRYLYPLVMRHLDEFVANAKRALFMHTDEDYVVDLDHTRTSNDLCAQVTIVDRNTGVDLATSQWNGGLHQFLQLKHGCRLVPLSLKAVFVSNVSYLKGYKRLNGFSGTLGSTEESKSLKDLYGADLMRIPTYKPKNFYEHVPLLANTEDEWFKEIYSEIADQVEANRSVLLICRTIADVTRMHRGLLNKLKHVQATGVVRKSIEEAIIYKREFDEFNFKKTDGLLPATLIISTNLAGRGTDIEISTELRDAKGLHVIVSFLPENTRIEEQAFGRAARCGHPGSGQIIALLDDSNWSAEFGQNPNIFQVKQFRDNAEVHRLQSLKSFYVYHTAVEETCLMLFRDHCSDVLARVYSSSSQEDTNLPTAAQVVYFALLDEWALWLDERAADIERCAKSCSDFEKQRIIESVNDFLGNHPLPTANKTIEEQRDMAKITNTSLSRQADAKKADELLRFITNSNSGVNNTEQFAFDEIDVSSAATWIRSPQPLFSMVLIHLAKGDPIKANALLDDILDRFPEYGAEAHYYKGVIAQRKIREVRKAFISNDNADREELRQKVVNCANWLTGKVMSGVSSVLGSDYLPDCVVLLLSEHQKDSEKHFYFARGQLAARLNRRQDVASFVLQLAQRAGPAEVRSRGFEEQNRELSAVIESIIGNIDDMVGHAVSPETLADDPTNVHLEDVFYFRSYIARAALTSAVLSPEVSDLQFKTIESRHGITRVQQAIAYQLLRDGSGIQTCGGKPVISPSILRKVFRLPSATDFWNLLTQLGCFKEQQLCIAVKEENLGKVAACVADLKNYCVPNNPETIQLSETKLDDLKLFAVEDECLVKTKSAVNEKLYAAVELGLASIEMMGTVDLPRVLTLRRLPVFDCVLEEDLIETLLIDQKMANWILQNLVTAKVLEMETVEMRRETMPDELRLDDNNTEQKDDEQKDVCQRTAYRLIGRVDCSSLPQSLQDAVEKVLHTCFAYGRALAALQESLRNTSIQETRHRILLPVTPYVDLHKDLIECGVVQAPRVAFDFDEIFEEKNLRKGVYKKMLEKRGNLSEASCDLLSSEAYFNEKGVSAGIEARKVVQNGMRQLAVIKSKKLWMWFLGMAVLAVSAIVTLGIFLSLMVAIAFALTVTAAVGTTVYFKQLRFATSRIAKKTRMSHSAEMMMLRDFHKSATEKHEQMAIDNIMIGNIRNALNFYQCSIRLKASEIVSEALCQAGYTDKISEADQQVIWNAISERSHRSILVRGIELWIQFLATHIQKSVFRKSLQSLKNATEIFEGCDSSLNVQNLPDFMAPRIFLRLVSHEMNKRIEEDVLPNVDGEHQTKRDLAERVRALAEAEVETNLKKWVHPCGALLSGYILGKRESEELTPDELTMKCKRKAEANAATIAAKTGSDFMARDLHRVLLRAAYRNPTAKLLRHMLEYNYPLSAHCATKIFDSLVNLLKERMKSSPTFHIVLKDDNVPIFSYFVTERTPPTEIRLVDHCFWMTTPRGAENTVADASSVFQALCISLHDFAAHFTTGTNEFRADLAKHINDDNPPFTREITWHGNEQLLCHFAI